MVTGDFTDKTPKIWGSFAQKFVYDPFQQPQWDAQSVFLNMILHNKERFELYLGCYGILLMNLILQSFLFDQKGCHCPANGYIVL